MRIPTALFGTRKSTRRNWLKIYHTLSRRNDWLKFFQGLESRDLVDGDQVAVSWAPQCFNKSPHWHVFWVGEIFAEKGHPSIELLNEQWLRCLELPWFAIATLKQWDRRLFHRTRAYGFELFKKYLSIHAQIEGCSQQFLDCISGNQDRLGWPGNLFGMANHLYGLFANGSNDERALMHLAVASLSQQIVSPVFAEQFATNYGEIPVRPVGIMETLESLGVVESGPSGFTAKRAPDGDLDERLRR